MLKIKNIVNFRW
jgi:hypothetical protein